MAKNMAESISHIDQFFIPLIMSDVGLPKRFLAETG